MGIGRTEAETLIANIKAGTPTRAAYRRQLGKAYEAIVEKMNKLDAQDAAAPVDFAATKQGQFDTFVAALPDPVLKPEQP